MIPLNFADAYSLGSTKKNQFKTSTIKNATAYQCQILCQPHTSHNRCPRAYILYSAATVKRLNPFSVNTQNFTLRFVAMNKSVKTFDGIEHYYTSEEHLHEIDAQMIFTMREKPLDPEIYNQKHKQKMAYIQCFLSGVASGWILQLHESYKDDSSASLYSFKKQFSAQKIAYYAQFEAQALTRKKVKP